MPGGAEHRDDRFADGLERRQATLQSAHLALGVLERNLRDLRIGSLLSGLTWLVWLAGVIFSIIGFTKAKDGIAYRYPFAFRFIK